MPTHTVRSTPRGHQDDGVRLPRQRGRSPDPARAVRPFVFAGYGGMSSISNDASEVPSDTTASCTPASASRSPSAITWPAAGRAHHGAASDPREASPSATRRLRRARLEALGGFYLNFGEVEKIRRSIEEGSIVAARRRQPRSRRRRHRGRGRQVPQRRRGQGRLRGRGRLPRSGQRQGRHPRRAGQVPEPARGQGRLRGRGRLPRSGQRQGRHPRRQRQVPRRARDEERLQGRGRLPRRGAAGGEEVHGGHRGHQLQDGQATILPGSYRSSIARSPC